MVRQDKRPTLKDERKIMLHTELPRWTRKKTRPRFITSDFINFVGNVLLWKSFITSEHTPLSKFRYFWFYARLILLTLARE